MTTTRKNAGYSLVELLVTLALGMFIMMAALSILTDFFRTQTSIKHANTLLTTSENIFNELTNVMHDSVEADISFQQLKLTDPEGDVTFYELIDGRILRDGRALTPPEVKVLSFELIDRSLEPAPSLIHLTLELESNDPRTSKASLSRSTTISLRANRSPIQDEVETP